MPSFLSSCLGIVNGIVNRMIIILDLVWFDDNESQFEKILKTSFSNLERTFKAMVASPQQNITTLFSTICSNYYGNLLKKKKAGV